MFNNDDLKSYYKINIYHVFMSQVEKYIFIHLHTCININYNNYQNYLMLSVKYIIRIN